MNSKIFDGAAVTNYEVSMDDALAVSYHLLDAIVERLIATGAPPDRIVENLMELASGVVSRLEPPDKRFTFMKRLVRDFESVTAKKAAMRRGIEVPPTFQGGKMI